MLSKMSVYVCVCVLLIVTGGYCESCDKTYTSLTGKITSPGYGNGNYSNHQRCTHTIKITPPFTGNIIFTVDDFDLERKYDYLKFDTDSQQYDGGSFTKGNERLYGFKTIFNVLFYSDSSISGRGFRVDYEIAGCSNRGCTTCQSGWRGRQKCQSGKYGEMCLRTCSDGCSNTCDKEEGTCTCKPGKTGSKCFMDCPDGSYGSNCVNLCSEGCRDRNCDKTDGTCDCKPGYQGNKCSEPKECQAGRYGGNCTRTCSAGCSNTCDKEEGTCTCKPGKTGSKCFMDCPDGSYGSYCVSLCNDGCRDRNCDKTDGTCVCKPGYHGFDCSEHCPAGYYGTNCSDQCSQGCVNRTCDPGTGLCECKAGWSGSEFEEQRKSQSAIHLIGIGVGVGIGATVVITILIAAGLFAFRVTSKRRLNRPHTSLPSVGSLTRNTQTARPGNKYTAFNGEREEPAVGYKVNQGFQSPDQCRTRPCRPTVPEDAQKKVIDRMSGISDDYEDHPAIDELYANPDEELYENPEEDLYENC